MAVRLDEDTFTEPEDSVLVPEPNEKLSPDARTSGFMNKFSSHLVLDTVSTATPQQACTAFM